MVRFLVVLVADFFTGLDAACLALLLDVALGFVDFLPGLAKIRSQFCENSGEAPERTIGPLIG